MGSASLPPVDLERLATYLVAKHVGFPCDIETIVATTVADVWLVLDGALTVEDFAPKAEP